MIRTIALNKLVRSPRNVRRATEPQADLQLKADIKARGLLQNLVVMPVAKPRGRFAVEAGDRRFRALTSLAEDGDLPKDLDITCFVIEDAAAAQEASLAENFQRLSMNPADECLAFGQLIEQGADAEGIARRFGLTVRFVEGRLRLASLAPVVFEALGAGEISLDLAKAYAVTPDQERQAYVFAEMSRGYGVAHPDSIRRMMTQATASATDRRARFVGEEAYVAAGGRIERDLFADDAATRWLDVAILERLAGEKLERLAAEAAAKTGLAFVRPTLDSWIGHSQLEGLRRVPVETPPLTDEETARVDDLEGEIEALVDALEDEETEESEREAAEAKVRDLSDRIDAIVDKQPAIDEALKAQVGTFLILDDQGRPRLDSGYYAERLSGEAAIADDEPDAMNGGGATRKPAGLSQRLVDELAMQRRDILAVHIAADQGLALDLAIFLMIDREAGYSGEKSGSSLIASPPSNPVLDFKTPEAAATIAREQAREALDRSWTKAFRALPDEVRAAWLGHAVARTLEASLNLPGERGCAFHDHLGRLLDIDVARWWRPTGSNFFDRVPKGVTLAALEEVGGAVLASRYAKAKKAELAQSCQRMFSGDFIAEVEVKEAAKAWVPDVMRFAPVMAEPDPPELACNQGDVDETDRTGEANPSPTADEIEEAA
jgi:ParB family transcriptional regulator, chromosome partitioning protein